MAELGKGDAVVKGRDEVAKGREEAATGREEVATGKTLEEEVGL